MALNLFLVLTAYYMLKTIREALILTEGGAAVKAYSSAGQAVLLLLLVPAFGAFASRVNRVLLLRGVNLFFVSNIVLFFILGRAGVHLGVPFFIWVGIFNVMIVAQYWAFANDIYTPEQGKRLFAIVALGSNVRGLGRRGVGRTDHPHARALPASDPGRRGAGELPGGHGGDQSPPGRPRHRRTGRGRGEASGQGRGIPADREGPLPAADRAFSSWS